MIHALTLLAVILFAAPLVKNVPVGRLWREYCSWSPTTWETGEKFRDFEIKHGGYQRFGC